MTTASPGPLTPLHEVRSYVAEGREHHGVICPSCDQFAKVYRRSINRPMVVALAKLDRACNAQNAPDSTYVAWDLAPFVHLPTVVGYGGDAAKLAYWGLIEEEAGVREDGGRHGWWRVTQLGHRWLNGWCTVDRWALIYSGTFLRYDGPPRSVYQAYGQMFDLRELMEA